MWYLGCDPGYGREVDDSINEIKFVIHFKLLQLAGGFLGGYCNILFTFVSG